MTFIDQLKTHSKAWEEFERWYESNNCDIILWVFTDTFTFEMQSGVFIAFLDSKGIIIHPEVDISDNIENIPNLFRYQIWSPHKYEWTQTQTTNDRVLVEKSAILKSFKILEKTLTPGKN